MTKSKIGSIRGPYMITKVIKTSPHSEFYFWWHWSRSLRSWSIWSNLDVDRVFRSWCARNRSWTDVRVMLSNSFLSSKWQVTAIDLLNHIMLQFKGTHVGRRAFSHIIFNYKNYATISPYWLVFIWQAPVKDDAKRRKTLHLLGNPHIVINPDIYHPL